MQRHPLTLSFISPHQCFSSSPSNTLSIRYLMLHLLINMKLLSQPLLPLAVVAVAVASALTTRIMRPSSMLCRRWEQSLWYYHIFCRHAIIWCNLHILVTTYPIIPTPHPHILSLINRHSLSLPPLPHSWYPLPLPPSGYLLFQPLSRRALQRPSLCLSYHHWLRWWEMQRWCDGISIHDIAQGVVWWWPSTCENKGKQTPLLVCGLFLWLVDWLVDCLFIRSQKLLTFLPPSLPISISPYLPLGIVLLFVFFQQQ